MRDMGILVTVTVICVVLIAAAVHWPFGAMGVGVALLLLAWIGEKDRREL